MQWHFTDGWDLGDFSEVVTFSVDTKLTADQKRPFIVATASAASKALTLDLAVGDVAFVANVGGANAFTLKNVAGDSGTSLATGKVAIVVASQTANASKVYVLN